MRSILQRLFNNLWLKLLALALASMLSAYVYLDGNYLVTDVLVASLRVKDLQQSLIVVEPLPFPKSVEFRVRGPLRAIRKLKGQDIKAFIDAGEQLSPGDGVFQVQLQETDFGEVDLVSQEPERLYVRFETKKEITLPVDISRIGEVADSFEIVSESVSPGQVTIEGPQPLVDSIAAARVEPRLAGVSKDLERMLPVQLYDSATAKIDTSREALTVDPAAVNYTMTLVPVGSLKVLKVVPQLTGQLPGGLLLDKITTKPVYVPVSTELASEDAAFVRTAPINMTDVTESFSVQVKLEYPFDLPVESDLPQTCEVFVEVAALEDIAAALVTPELEGQDSRFEYVLSPPGIAVVSEELASLDENSRGQISAVLKVDGLEPGEYRLTPQLRLPVTLSQFSLRPASVTVTVIENNDED